jgi:hypothetical protein
MRCLCPKCKESIELDLEEIPEDGTFTKCTECSAGFLLRKESFARRALHHGEEITCAECGNTLGPSIYCQSCHALYPDFYAAETSSAAKNKLGKLLGKLNISRKLSKHPSAAANESTSGGPAQQPKKIAGIRLPGQPAQLAATLLIILLFIGGGGYFWYQNSIETKYAEAYVRVLFSIKNAADFELKTCNRVANDWKTSMTPAAPKLTGQEQLIIKRAQTDIETLMKRMGDTPEKFKPSSDALAKHYESYTNLQNFASAPAGSMDSYTATLKRLEDDFNTNAKALKAALPEKVSLVITENKAKYKALQGL